MRSVATLVALFLLALQPAAAQQQVLPPVEPDSAGASGPRIRVEGFRIQGVTAFDESELREAVAPWIGAELATEELVAVRNALTQLYVDAGYVNSGAVVPDQDLADGIVEIWIVEGTLADIDVRGARYYRENVLRDRLAVGLERPLRVDAVERNLQFLQQDPRIRRVHARLVPGERSGEAVLVVRVEEESPWDLDLEVSNHAPVSFGAYEGRVLAGHRNLLGLGDVLDARVRVASGLIRVDGQYDVPINARGTRLKLRGEYADSEVREAPFDILEIQTDYVAGRVMLEHPLYRSETDLFNVGIVAEWRRAETCFGIEPIDCSFTFTGSGAEDGRTTVSLLRFTQDWSRRSSNQVIAARSRFTLGLPILGATAGGSTDDEFFVWLGQVQWARRFDPWGIQAIVRGDVQLSNTHIPSLERVPIGGHASVRGYRENQLVRDQGAVASVELRVPLWRAEGRPILEIAPFFDFGWSKNQNEETPTPQTISSAGVGLRWAVTRRLSAQVYWGYQLERDIPSSGNLQDDGVQFQLRWDAF